MISTIVISVILAAIVMLIICRMIKGRLQGKGGCGCGCAGCGGCCKKREK